MLSPHLSRESRAARMPERRRLRILVAAILTLAACTDTRDAPVAPHPGPSPLAVSDGANGGNPRFYFLPPLVPAPSGTLGIFDPNLSPEVRICHLAGGSCDADVVTFVSGVGGVAVDVAGQSYSVVWQTRDYGLTTGDSYRVHVYLGVRQLGYLDLTVVARQPDVGTVPAGYVGVVNNRPVTIKFRIEIGAIGVLAFASNRDGDRAIYIMETDGSGVVRLSNNAANDQEPARSPDGTKVAFIRGIGTPDEEIYVVNIDGSGAVNISNNPARDLAPSWSPDSKKIVFQSNRDEFAPTGSDWEIYVASADGSGTPTRLTTSVGQDLGPVWSPDGIRIAFASARDGSADVFVMNPDGTGQTNLTNSPGSDAFPAWSPNSQRIAFVSDRDGNAEIYVMFDDGTGQTNLTNNAAADGAPTYSPTLAQIAFLSNRDGDSEVYLMQTDGTAQTNVSSDPGHDTWPAWSPNGRFLAFHSNRDGDFEVHRLTMPFLTLTKLTDNSLFFDAQPSWGRR